MSKERIETAAAPPAQGPYSQAIASGDLVFTAGQGGLDPVTATPAEGVEAQTELTLKNLGAVLEAAGCGFEDVVKTTCFLADMADFKAFNAVYARFFPEPAPARSTVAAKDLPLGLLVEVEAIAVRP